ncbi:ParB N-terminal domain-containing protein, partial [Alicyclobacillus contaminans]|uniref:ParB N-terminal domain-containing protein n=1 Tax=Alicyclobacillus contaminans TaxID=392016 RepID=UPI00047A094E
MLIDIEKIVVEDRIRKDFGNLQELADDIRENGLINPPVVTPEYHLIAGERRLRACRLLGYRQIEVRVMTVKDYEHQLRLEISENENRKEFTFSERVEWARRLERVEALKAKERQGSRTDLSDNIGQNFGRSSEIAAKVSGFGSDETYRKAKFIADHADEETIRQLDKGELSIHRAYQDLKKQLERTQAEL